MKKGKAPALDMAKPETRTAINTFSKHLEQADRLAQAFQESFDADVMRLSEAISSIVSNSRFREAVTLQNRAALIIGLDKLLMSRAASSQARTKETRRSEVRAASYWQRYCVKNDTISFFGPVGWAKWVPQGETIIAKPGRDFIAQRNLYFEGWCIDALAETIAQDEAIGPWIAPRRMPNVHIEETTISRHNEGVVNLSPKEMAIIRACDGTQAAKDIAKRLAASTFLFEGEEEVYQLLDQLDSYKLVSWRFEVPWDLQIPHEWHIESNLRRKLEGIGDEVVQDRALRLLDELDSARIEVARAAGNAERLNQAMQEMEETFTRLTNAAATRRHGKMYSGRTLVYEDCRRDIEVKLGPSLLTELGPPLTLLLVSARWFISKVSAGCIEAFRGIYAELSQKAGSPVVDFSSFWLKAQPFVFGNRKLLYGNILQTLQQKWSNILSIPRGQKRVSYNSEQLRSPVLEAFNTHYGGWQYGRYNSPDIMIAASSQEAIRQGRYRLVLGEFHVGTNSLANKLFVSQHPSPQEIISALDRDLPKPRIVPVPDKQIYTSRDHTLVTTAKDFRLLYSHDISAISSEKALPIATLVVEDSPQGLVVRTRDGRLRFDMIEAFADLLSERVANHFKILPHDDHVPRVSFDRLIVNRETWRFSPSALAFALEKDEASRFLEARRWARAHDIPRFVFVKSPTEEKPFYVDFDSPVLINLFARVVGQCAEMTMAGSVDPALVVTEMLPRPDQVWLPDAEGNRYTSEIRIVAVDLARDRKANV